MITFMNTKRRSASSGYIVINNIFSIKYKNF
jgi:hypothetical protein